MFITLTLLDRTTAPEREIIATFIDGSNKNTTNTMLFCKMCGKNKRLTILISTYKVACVNLSYLESNLNASVCALSVAMGTVAISLKPSQ